MLIKIPETITGSLLLLFLFLFLLISFLLAVFIRVLALRDGDFLLEHAQLSGQLLYLDLVLVVLLLYSPSLFGYLQSVLSLLLHLLALLPHHRFVAEFSVL
jgi:hypothetical protein